MNLFKLSGLGKFKKAIVTALLVFSLAIAPMSAPPAHALWGEFPSIGFEGILDYLRDMISGIIMGSLKQAAFKQINIQMSGTIGGSSAANAKFIVNWTDYLDTAPTKNTNKYMNDYISQMTAGRGSAAGYQSAEGFGGNYIGQMASSAKIGTTERAMIRPTYVGNPSQNLFAGGNLNNFNSYLSGVNNPWAFNMHIEQKYQEKLAAEKEVARTKSIAYQGFKGTEENGYTTSPGSLTKDAMANAQDVGNKILASAKSMPEVITAVVQQMISKSVENGIGNVKANVQREVGNTQSKVVQQINTQTQTAGPGALYR